MNKSEPTIKFLSMHEDTFIKYAWNEMLIIRDKYLRLQVVLFNVDEYLNIIFFDSLIQSDLKRTDWNEMIIRIIYS